MTEEEYKKLCERLVKGAEYLDNPLLREEERKKGQRVYDEIERKILEYKGLIK